jgi:hypothetical protein
MPDNLNLYSRHLVTILNCARRKYILYFYFLYFVYEHHRNSARKELAEPGSKLAEVFFLELK